MKNASLPLLIILLAVLLGACTSQIGEIREFQLYDGSDAVVAGGPPTKVIRGRIDTTSIELEYMLKDSTGEQRLKAVLVGEDYRRAMELVKATSVIEVNPEERLTGGNAFDVTLIDEKGRSVIGEPNNKSDWQRFEEEIELRVFRDSR